jgi:hypothetical protein
MLAREAGLGTVLVDRRGANGQRTAKWAHRAFQQLNRVRFTPRHRVDERPVEGEARR